MKWMNFQFPSNVPDPNLPASLPYPSSRWHCPEFLARAPSGALPRRPLTESHDRTLSLATALRLTDPFPRLSLLRSLPLSDLVNQAYGLTPDEVRMMWATAPPRMPLTSDVEASDQAEDEAAA